MKLEPEWFNEFKWQPLADARDWLAGFIGQTLVDIQKVPKYLKESEETKALEEFPNVFGKTVVEFISLEPGIMILEFSDNNLALVEELRLIALHARKDITFETLEDLRNRRLIKGELLFSSVERPELATDIIKESLGKVVADVHILRKKKREPENPLDILDCGLEFTFTDGSGIIAGAFWRKDAVKKGYGEACEIIAANEVDEATLARRIPSRG